MFPNPVIGANESSPPPTRVRKPARPARRPGGRGLQMVRKIFVFLLGATLFVYAYNHQTQLQNYVNGRLDWVYTRINDASAAAALRQQTTERENEVNQASQ